jgi:putative spermidine/putrescine transport system substrate-binding protein
VKKLLVTMCAALMVVLAACGGDSSDDSSDSASKSSGGDLSGEQMTMVTWGGETTDMWIDANVAPFEQQSGLKVVQDAPVDYTKVKAQVQSGNVTWDLIEGDPYAVTAECGTLFEEQPDVDQSGVDPLYERASECYSPIGVFAYVLTYDNAKFGSDAPTNWEAFFDTETYPGKRGVFNYYYGGLIEAALLADGVAADELYPLDLDRAFEKLDTIKDDLVFYDTLAESVEQVRSNSVAMSIMMNTRAYQAVDSGADYAAVWDDALNIVDGWAIPKGAPNAAAASALLEYMLTPEAQAAVLEIQPVGSTVKGVEMPKDKLLRSFVPSSPEHLEKAIVMDQAWYAENQGEVSQRFTDWAAG